MNVRLIRDVVTLCAGTGLLFSQVVLQFLDKSTDLALIAAALSLLGVVPLFQAGDRQRDKETDPKSNTHANT